MKALTSPGELAFDRCLLPFAVSLLLSLIETICFIFLVVDADLSSWPQPPHVLWPVVGVGLAIYWFWSLGAVLRSWYDPQGRILRFASLASLFMLFLTCVGLLIPMPLIAKAVRGDVRRVKMLLAEGGDVNAVDMQGMTLLHWEAGKGHRDVVELLLAHGANVNAKETQHGMTPLQFAAEDGHKDVVEVLLTHGADVNAKDKHGTTPLEWAAMWGRKEIVELLLSKGADVNAKDNKGKTPLRLALDNNQEDMGDLLRQHGGKE